MKNIKEIERLLIAVIAITPMLLLDANAGVGDWDKGSSTEKREEVRFSLAKKVLKVSLTWGTEGNISSNTSNNNSNNTSSNNDSNTITANTENAALGNAENAAAGNVESSVVGNVEGDVNGNGNVADGNTAPPAPPAPSE